MSKKLTIEFVLSRTNNNNPKNIKSLNLWNNKISDISMLSEFPSLEIISLSTNQVKDISVFKKLKNIRELYLKDNQITDLNQIENLKNCKKLEKLVLKDNPIANDPNYIYKIIEILPQLKRIDDIDIKEVNNNSNEFNSPLANKDNNQIINSNNYNIQSPDNSKNNLSCKSGSDSISSDKKGDPRNDSAAPDPQTLLYQDNLNINDNNHNGINVINSFNDYNVNFNNNNSNNKIKDKSDLLNRSFKKKITEGSFRKITKKKNSLNNNNSNNNININNNINNKNNISEEGKKKLLERSINDNKIKNEKLSQTLTSGFYKKNPFKKNSGSASNEKCGYRKKIIGNFKQEQEHKDSNNKNKQNITNSVLKKYQYFDNDNSNENAKEEEKKKNNENPEKINIFKKINKLKPLMSSEKKIGFSHKNDINGNDKNGKNEKVEKINQSVVDSIKILMSTLSNEGLKQIQNDIQKLIEIKNKK